VNIVRFSIPPPGFVNHLPTYSRRYRGCVAIIFFDCQRLFSSRLNIHLVTYRTEERTHRKKRRHFCNADVDTNIFFQVLRVQEHFCILETYHKTLKKDLVLPWQQCPPQAFSKTIDSPLLMVTCLLFLPARFSFGGINLLIPS
jgi:hypothetical protein